MQVSKPAEPSTAGLAAASSAPGISEKKEDDEDDGFNDFDDFVSAPAADNPPKNQETNGDDDDDDFADFQSFQAPPPKKNTIVEYTQKPVPGLSLPNLLDLNAVEKSSSQVATDRGWSADSPAFPPVSDPSDKPAASGGQMSPTAVVITEQDDEQFDE